ncbi:MAG: hypothetical protein ABI946_09385 [Chthoniobacterales bacterium]
MTSGTSPAEYTPIFDWSVGRRRKVSLFSFIAGSVALHALCFYLFQIVYPVTVALSPPPARVNLITPQSEQGRVLLRWIEAEDPALSSTTQRPPDSLASLPPEPAHVPSYVRTQPALKQLPALRPDLSIPSAEPPGPVRLPRHAAPSPAAPIATRIQFAEDTRALGNPEFPPLKFTASQNEPPAAAQFRIAIGPRGAVHYCFLENSSGDRVLDEQARHALLLCRFPAAPVSASPNDQSLWTTATIQWGSDVTMPSKPSPDSPAP